MLLLSQPINLTYLVKTILRPDVLVGVTEAPRDGNAAPDSAEASNSPCDLRRVLIFIDSKVMCSKLVRELSKPSFKKPWSDSVGVAVSTTPYHGDVARRDRRLYEKNMGEFMPKCQLHFIVATSALEAGTCCAFLRSFQPSFAQSPRFTFLNDMSSASARRCQWRGTDVVILLSTKYCSQSSVLRPRAMCTRQTSRRCIVGCTE